MGHTASKIEKGWLRIFFAVSLAMTVPSFATSMSLADDPPFGEPLPVSPAMEGTPSTLPSEPASPTEAGEVQERAVIRDQRMQPGQFAPSQSTPPPPTRPMPGTSLLIAPVPLSSGLAVPLPTSPAPTPNIAAIAKAMRYDMRSLSILVFAPSGLPLTHPVTISIGFFPTGTALGPRCQQRVTQVYAISTGNTFLCSLPDIVDRQGVIMHLDITLSESKSGGGVYSYNLPLTVDPVPIYDVTISPLQFTLLETCNLIGDTEILFSWYAPDGRPNQKQFHTRGGQRVSIGEFQWSHTEVVYNLLYRQPSLMFSTINATDLTPPLIVSAKSAVNLWPGKTHTVELGLVKAANEDTCQADIRYSMTYTLREYFGDPHVRDHR
jgi:hypothetical protein